MKEIFEGAKFGDKFVTRDGNVAIFNRRFIRTCHAAPCEPSYQGVSLMVKGQAYLVEKGLDGKDMTDYYIISSGDKQTHNKCTDKFIGYKDAYAAYTFADDTPFGKLIGE